MQKNKTKQNKTKTMWKKIQTSKTANIIVMQS